MICFHNCYPTCLCALLWFPSAWSLLRAEVFLLHNSVSYFLSLFFPYPSYQPLTCFQLQSQREETSCSLPHQSSELLKPVPADIGRVMMTSFRCHESLLWPLGCRNRLFLSHLQHYKRYAEVDRELLTLSTYPQRARDISPKQMWLRRRRHRKYYNSYHTAVVKGQYSFTLQTRVTFSFLVKYKQNKFFLLMTSSGMKHLRKTW